MNAPLSVFILPMMQWFCNPQCRPRPPPPIANSASGGSRFAGGVDLRPRPGRFDSDYLHPRNE